MDPLLGLFAAIVVLFRSVGARIPDVLGPARCGTIATLLIAGGMTIMQPSEALAAKLQEIGETMTAEWEAQAGSTGQAVVEAYRNSR